MDFVFNRSLFIKGISMAGLIILLGALLLLLLIELFVRPVKIFIKGTEEIAKGNLDYRFEIKTGDEIEQLAKQFNQMTESLRKSRNEIEEARDILEVRVNARTKELQEQAKGLDEQVGVRTRELQERIDELERLHKLTVGREMKMVELKKKIQELEKRIKPSRDKSLTKKTKKK